MWAARTPRQDGQLDGAAPLVLAQDPAAVVRIGPAQERLGVGFRVALHRRRNDAPADADMCLLQKQLNCRNSSLSLLNALREPSLMMDQ